MQLNGIAHVYAVVVREHFSSVSVPEAPCLGTVAPSLRACRLAVVLVLLVVPACSASRSSGPARAGVDQTVATLVESLASDNEDERDRALSALVALGPAAIGSLKQALKHPDEDVRLGIVEVAAEMRGPGAAEVLLAALADSSSDVRLDAVEALGQIGDRRAVQPLVEQYDRDPDPQVRYECLTSLGTIGDPAAADLLIRETSSDDLRARMWAIDALCIMKEARAWPIALALLRDDPNPSLRRRVLQSCGASLNSPEGWERLIAAALNEEDFELSGRARQLLGGYARGRPVGDPLVERMRQAGREALRGPRKMRGAFLLGEVGDRQATDLLVTALRDSDALVRQHAAYLLARTGDRRAVPALVRALGDEAAVVRATAHSSLQWFAQGGDQEAQEALERYRGDQFRSRLPR